MNPLSKIITDRQYRELNQLGALNETCVRNIGIRQKFIEMRNETDFSASEIIELIAKDYPYLTYESVYKAVYNKKHF